MFNKEGARHFVQDITFCALLYKVPGTCASKYKVPGTMVYIDAAIMV